MNRALLESHSEGVATLTLNRPASLNAMNGEMLESLLDSLPRLAADRNVRAVVVTGAGQAFCAGGDMGNFDNPKAKRAQDIATASRREFNVESLAHGLRNTARVSELLYNMPKPTLAVLPGVAAGAGLSLALACDLRIAADNVRLTTAFSRIGLSGDMGGSFFLTQLVGAAKARELYFLSPKLMATDALALGLLNRVVSAEMLQETANELALSLARLPTIATGYIKKNLNMAQTRTLAEVLDMESLHMIRGMMTRDHREGVLAFMEQRTPHFSGR